MPKNLVKELNIKVAPGALVIDGKRKAMEKIVEMSKDYIEISKPVHVMVHYTDNIAPTEELKELISPPASTALKSM